MQEEVAAAAAVEAAEEPLPLSRRKSRVPKVNHLNPKTTKRKCRHRLPLIHPRAAKPPCPRPFPSNGNAPLPSRDKPLPVVLAAAAVVVEVAEVEAAAQEGVEEEVV